MKTVLGALFGAVGSTLACWRLVLLLWLLNAVLAAVVVAPLMGAIDATWRHSPLAPSLPGAFDDAPWVDFANVQAPALAASRANAETLTLPWIVLCWLLSAAVLGRTGDRPNFTGHLAAVGRCAHRYLWLLVMTGLGLAGVAWVNGLLTDWTTNWLTLGLDRGAGAGLLGWSMTAKTLLSLLLAALVLGAGRVARLRVVKLDERLMPLTWLRALGSLLRRLHVVGPAMLLALVPLALVALGYRLVTDGVLGDGWLDGPWASWRVLAFGQAAQLLVDDAGADIATLSHRIDALADWLNPNVVKVVCDHRGRAHYFSRAPIPWQREGTASPPPRLPDAGAWRHIGIYAYRVSALNRFSTLAPAPIEQSESLEQLRALWNGLQIVVGEAQQAPPHGVDTEADLQAVIERIERAQP